MNSLSSIAPRINYLVPEVNIVINNDIFTKAAFLEMDASCYETAASSIISLSDTVTNLKKVFRQVFDTVTNLNSDDEITIDWGYSGNKLSRIFTGFVRKVEERRTDSLIHSIDKAALLIDKKITKTYKNETPSTIIQSMLTEAGVDNYEIDDVSVILDRLPLLNNNIVEALYLINRRLGLKHNFRFDENGKFHWQKRDKAPHSGYLLEWGKNIISLIRLDNGIIKLSTIGLPLYHSLLINIINKDGAEKTYFIERVKHKFGPGMRGSRTTLWLSEINF